MQQEKKAVWKFCLIGLMVMDLVFAPMVVAGSSRLTGVARPGSLANSLPTVASDALPTGWSYNDAISEISVDDDSASMNILQTEDGAVLSWDTFDIGEDASVVFDQGGNSSWSALNRIYDSDPSQIFGQLSAEGKIILINQNGFYFSSTACIGNLHTLVASSLNMADDDFEAGNYNFYIDDYNGQDDNYTTIETAVIENEGQIDVQSGGAIYLIAPEVYNGGSLDAYGGHAALIAGEEVELSDDDEDGSTRTQKLVRVTQNPGEATNAGSITAEQGIAGMYAGVVNQEGLVTAVTAVYGNGTVELLASEKIYTSADSTTGTPLSDSDDTVDGSYETDEGSVTLGGLDTGGDVDDDPDWIELYGEIVSPSGNVTITAEDRIYVAPGSSIDVSGVWDERSASDNQIEMTLNSVELSDDFLARVGSLLGETIYVNALVGTSIGHIDSYLDAEAVSVYGQSTDGGSITMKTTADDSDIIIEEGASISFAGGGINYSAGLVETSKVLIGDTIYDIGSIPDEILEMADEIELVDNETAARYGTTYIDAYQEGDDAGSLTIVTDTLVLNDDLDGSVTKGTYQTLAEEPSVTYGEGDDTITYQTASGLSEPDAGTLIIGVSGDSKESIDRRINAVVFQADIQELDEEVENADPDVYVLDGDTTYLSSDILNAAGLGSLKVYANTSIEIRSDADLVLEASHGSGEVEFVARRIDDYGSITVPGGTVAFYNDVNTTSASIDMDEWIHLYDGAVIDVSGETWNNYNDSDGLPDQLHLDGGTIILQARGKLASNAEDSDESEGVYVDEGAVVDVNDGYAVDYDGDVTGGDAGALTIEGREIVLDGDISGYSLVGYSGGTLTLKSSALNIVHASGATESITAASLTDWWLAQSGFAHLDLYSDGSLVVGDKVNLQPSTVKYTAPIGNLVDMTYVDASDYDADETEATSVELTAHAVTFSGGGSSSTSGDAVFISGSAAVEVTPGGTIDLEGPVIAINGDLEAPGGSVTATSSVGGITLGSGASIDVSGYAQQLTYSLSTGLPLVYAVVAGGSVDLEASEGTITMADGSWIDVSGSKRVANYYRNIYGGKESYRLAAEAGSISLTGEAFNLNGEFIAQTYMSGLTGGSLSIASTNYSGVYTITQTALESYVQSGFDALAFSSITGLQFGAADDERDIDSDGWALRELILDAPVVSAYDGQDVHLEATYVQLDNNDEKYIDLPEYDLAPTSTVDEGQTNTLELAGQWLDIAGSVSVDGFDAIHLSADLDMTLADVFYEENSSTGTGAWAGGLYTYADLKLTAGRIYPTTDTIFTISTGAVQDDGTWLGGSVEIAQSHEASLDGAILSANGQVTIETNTLAHNGTLLAPMGRIILTGMGEDSQIILGENSVLSTDSDTAVEWGDYEDGEWLRVDHAGDDLDDTVEVDGSPERYIDIVADTVTAEEGSTIDVSGGGVVYATEFEASISGSADPLTVAGRYVIISDNSVQLPGEAVYLSGIDGIEDGTYSLLPIEYAYLDGAIVLTDLGSIYNTVSDTGDTLAGYDTGIGYTAVMGTGLVSTEAHLYAVRSAADILKEGSYNGIYSVAGSGGSLTVNSSNGQLEATYYGSGLSGYDGGQAWISSVNMELTAADYFGSDNEILYFDPQTLFGAGFETVIFGYDEDADAFADLVGPLADAFVLLDDNDDVGISLSTTETLVVHDVDFSGNAIGLYAGNSIDIQSNVTIGGSDNTNELVLASAGGTITVADDGTTSIEADVLGIYAYTMEAGSVFETGEIVAIAGSGTTELVDADYVSDGGAEEGVLRIYSGLYDQFAEADSMAIAGTSGIRTVGQVSLGSAGLLYLNAPQLSSEAYSIDVDGATVSRQSANFSAASIRIDNSDTTAASDATETSGNMTFTASYDEAYEEAGLDTGEVQITGSVTLAAINQVDIVAQQEIVLAGEGSLTTDGDLTLSAGRVTAGAVSDDEDYESADFEVTTAGLLAIQTLDGQTAGTKQTAGGALSFTADTIVQSGTIDNFAGNISLTAENGLYLTVGSEIVANGGILEYTIADEAVYQAYAAGSVTLSSGGTLEIQGAAIDDEGNAIAAAIIDVSNDASDIPDDVDDDTWAGWLDDGYLDAGSLTIAAEESATVIGGTLLGSAAAQYEDASGQVVEALGGDFDLTAPSIDFSALNTTLDAGGFDHRISLRATTGSIIVAADDTMQAEQIQLAADAGGIDVSGTLDASGASDDRYIELYAQEDINLYAGSLLTVAGDDGADADGGDVIIDSEQGFVNMYATALIDVSASEDGSGTGGSVQFYASRYNNADADSTDDDADANDVRMALDGTITGAETVSVVAIRVYDDSNDGAYTASGDIGDAQIGNVADDTSDYMDAYTESVSNDGEAVEANLTLDGETVFAFMPGVEIVRDGDITLTDDWDFSDGNWRYGDDEDVPGMLTLRAAGDLTIAGDLTDEPQTVAQRLAENDSDDSWSYTLVAGADLDSTDPLATITGAGTFEIENQNLVYTESGTIRFASGGDTVIGEGTTRYYDSDLESPSLSTSYTLANYDGDITGLVDGNLTITGDKTGSNAGAIQSALGDISIDVSGDLTLGYYAAIRTTGETTATVTEEDVANDDALSWLITDTVTFLDFNTFEIVTTTYWDAIHTYQLDEQQSWSYGYLSEWVVKAEMLAAEQFDAYANGGSIVVNVEGDASGESSAYGFMRNYGDEDAVSDAAMAGASYVYTHSGSSGDLVYRPATGIVTMAEGNVTVDVGGDVGTTTDSGGLQVGAFGDGDLTLTAGGDVDGRFYIEDGRLAVMSMQDFGQQSAEYSIEAIDSTAGADVAINVIASGSIHLGSVIDPLMALYFEAGEIPDRDDIYSFHWTEETALTLTAVNGSITLSGESEFYDTESVVSGALPANVALIAGGDIVLTSNDALWILPGSTGGLQALAGGSIVGDTVNLSSGQRDYAEIVISNLAPEQLYYEYFLGEYDAVNDAYMGPQLTYGDYGSVSVVADSNGYLSAYEDAFNEWYEAQDEGTREAYQDVYQQVNDTGYNLHDGDSQAVVLIAGEDIDNLALNSPKQTQIVAGEDIADCYIRIQHPNDDDVSVLAAGGEIRFSLLPEYYNDGLSKTYLEALYLQSGIELAGAGDLIVAAGYDVNLGYSAGIRTVGSVPNDALSTTGADITLLAGYEFGAILQDADGNWDASVAETFFDLLLEAGINYTAIKYGEVTEGDEVEETDIDDVVAYGAAYARLLAGYSSYDDVPQTVRDELAALYLDEARADLIDAGLVVRGDDDGSDATAATAAEYVASLTQGIDFDTAAEAGDIRMTQSQIYTQQSGDINILVAGQFDVGVSSFSDEKSDTGINTMRGGDINIYARNDLNVNESRVMTWYGGDILIWSDHGDINAGKGSKTTVSVSDPEKVYDEETGGYVLKYTLPAVGSGIRLLTYDPDGTGPLTAPNAGNGYFFAPEGEIDAGEAGIVGQGNILLNALVLTNTQNISVGGLSSGASISQDASADVGALSGAGGLANAVNQMDEETELLSARERFSDYVAELSENLVPKWLSIEVIGFDDEEGEEDIPRYEEDGKETSDRGKRDGLTGATLDKFYNRQAGKL